MGTASDVLEVLGASPLWGIVKAAMKSNIDLQGALSEAKDVEALVKKSPPSIPGVQKRIAKLNKPDLTPAEIRRNIRKSLKLVKPRTKGEKDVQDLAGRKLTPGQVARYMGIGGAVVGSLGVGRRAVVASGMKGLGHLATREGLSTVAHPSAIAADALGGAAIGALPVLRRKMDIEAARRGQF